MKVPVMAAVMKNVEEGTLSLNTTVTILEEDLDSDYGPLAFEGAGKTYTVEELLVYETKFSDNTANRALHRQLKPLDFENAVLGSGLLYSSFFENKENIEYPLSAKEYSNLFRSLYYSTYLKRQSSNYLLSLLTEKEFKEGLRAGVPPEIPIAHKTGRWYDGNYIHDCGIVYYPYYPYILCTMTQNMTEEEAYDKTEEISRIVFEYVKNKGDSLSE